MLPKVMWIRHDPAVPEPELEEFSGDEDGVTKEPLSFGILWCSTIREDPGKPIFLCCVFCTFKRSMDHHGRE